MESDTGRGTPRECVRNDAISRKATFRLRTRRGRIHPHSLVIPITKQVPNYLNACRISQAVTFAAGARLGQPGSGPVCSDAPYTFGLLKSRREAAKLKTNLAQT